MPGTNLPACLWGRPVYKISSIYFSEGYFWEFVVGVHRPAFLIFTLFQRNIYKVNVREYPPSPGIYVVKTDNPQLGFDTKYLPMLSEGSHS